MLQIGKYACLLIIELFSQFGQYLADMQKHLRTGFLLQLRGIYKSNLCSLPKFKSTCMRLLEESGLTDTWASFYAFPVPDHFKNKISRPFF